MVTPDEQKWHWGEGNKYSMEAMKALLLLNGGGALALLAFFGNRAKMLTTVSTEAIDWSLIGFSVGTFSSVILFVFAYLTQLNYGNVGTEGRSVRNWWHYVAYFSLSTALLGFFAGIWFARLAVVAALT